jgi:hypothetical protein
MNVLTARDRSAQNPPVTRFFLFAVVLVACSSNTPSGGAGSDAGREARPDSDQLPDQLPADRGTDLEPPCGSAGKNLPSGLVELKWDQGQAEGHLRSQPLVITVDGKKYDLATAPLQEAVGFHLEHPARIHAFAVRWQNIVAGSDPRAELQAGLYRDFGYNGFDFWAPDPLWTGTRCVKDAQADQWLYYVFKQPLTVEHPGLVYVAHRSETSQDPVFAFESISPPVDCTRFEDCHSAVNLPTAAVIPSGLYYNGISSSFPRNFLVRLYVEYTATLPPSAKRFQQQTSIPSQSSSVSWGDFNNDGYDDLLVGETLYRNDGGIFTDISGSSGLAALKTGASGGVWGDYDNDGCLDLFLFTQQAGRADTLLRGDCQGRFEDVTALAQISDHQTYNDCGDPTNTTSPTAAAAWVDLDADGFLDLYLANFICWSSNTFYVDSVFHNRGDGTFEEWSGAHGFLSGATASRAVAPADFDGDGDEDLFVGNYRLQPNLLFVNDGQQSFTESAQSRGATGNQTASAYGHSIGAAWGDLDSDGDLDLVVANLAHPRFWHFSDRTQILINDGQGKFREVAPLYPKPYGNPSGLRYQETHSVPLLGDFDLDGCLDLAITCVYDGRPTDFYLGKGDGTFVLDAYASGISATNGWGIAASDYDNDGQLDLFATDLYRNVQAQPGRHFLEVRVVGNVKANRAAIGAVVKVIAGSQRWMRQVQGGTGQGCQDSMYLHFGLGQEVSVSEIQVVLPGGKTVVYAGPIAADQRVWLYEDGTRQLGWAPKP